MNKPATMLDAPAPEETRAQSQRPRRSIHPAALALLAVVTGFALPFYQLAIFALSSELYSYIVLIPVVSAYLVWQKREDLSFHSRSDPVAGSLLVAVGVVTLVGYLIARASAIQLAVEDQLALTTTSFLFMSAGLTTWWRGRAFLGALLFPFCLLLFMVPLPAGAMRFVETLMQHGSAAVAKLLFDVFETPVFYQDLNFQLPAINLHVAPECSGIRSTISLLIVSLVAGYFFLQTPGKRTLLAAVVVPLALLRNGFRIFTVGELCVHYGPQMIDSDIHRRGGPVFFALSLVPLFFLVLLLQKRERTAGQKKRPVNLGSR